MDITIEGKRFVPLVNGTFAHDIWLTRKIREAGLANIAIDEDETPDHFIERIAIVAHESGLSLQLLGALLLPDGVETRDWTPELAESTAQFFGNVTDPEGKRVLRTQIASALFYFFATALASSQTSPKFGTEAKERERQETADASTMATGTT